MPGKQPPGLALTLTLSVSFSKSWPLWWVYFIEYRQLAGLCRYIFSAAASKSSQSLTNTMVKAVIGKAVYSRNDQIPGALSDQRKTKRKRWQMQNNESCHAVNLLLFNSSTPDDQWTSVLYGYSHGWYSLVVVCKMRL